MPATSLHNAAAARRALLALAIVASMAVVDRASTPVAASSPVIVVDSIDDLPDADFRDDICETEAGTCSLRAAISTANEMLGSNTITFAIAGDGPHRIVVTRTLPRLGDRTGPTTIDGYTQPGSQPNTATEGSNAVINIEVEAPLGAESGQPEIEIFSIASPANDISGLAVFGGRTQFLVRGEDADGNRFHGNFVGTDSTGTYQAPQQPEDPPEPPPGEPDLTEDLGVGFLVEGIKPDGVDVGPDKNQIGLPTLAGRNIIAGNGDSGIRINFKGTTDNIVQNNVVGLSPDLSQSLRQGRGIDMQFETSGNLIGGDGPLDGNLVGGMRFQTGIEVSHGVENNFVIGNVIGTLGDGDSVEDYTRNNRGLAIKDGSRFNWFEANTVAGNRDVGLWNKHNYSGENTFVENRFGIGVAGTPLRHLDANIDLAGTDQIWWGNLFVNENTVNNNNTQIRVTNRNLDPSFFADRDGPTYTRANSIRQSQFHNGVGNDQNLPYIDFQFANGFAVCNAQGCVHDGIDAPTITGRGPGEVYGTACAGCEVEIYVSGTITADGSLDVSGTTPGTGLGWIDTVVADESGDFGLLDGRIAQGRTVSALAVDAIGNTSELPLGVFVPGFLAGASGTPLTPTGGIPRPERPPLPTPYDEPLPLVCEFDDGTLTWTDIGAANYTVLATLDGTTTTVGTFTDTTATVPPADTYTVRTGLGASLRETTCDGDGDTGGGTTGGTGSTGGGSGSTGGGSGSTGGGSGSTGGGSGSTGGTGSTDGPIVGPAGSGMATARRLSP